MSSRSMAVVLKRGQIERALRLVGPGLEQYLALQRSFRHSDVTRDREFQRAFNGYYRVRRGPEWQTPFYRLLARQKTRPLAFSQVLRRLHDRTGRVEASFASKLFATVDPSAPVIDSVVLGNLGLRLLRTGSPERRIAQAAELHAQMASIYRDYLSSEDGRRLVDAFTRAHPSAVGIARTKMLDLVLWQVR